MKPLRYEIEEMITNAKPPFILQMKHINNNKIWQAIGVLFIESLSRQLIKEQVKKNEINKSI